MAAPRGGFNPSTAAPGRVASSLTISSAVSSLFLNHLWMPAGFTASFPGAVSNPKPGFCLCPAGADGGMVPGGEDPQVLCDPLTFIPVEERHLLWSVLEKDGLFVEVPETFRDVRIAGTESFGKGTNLFF